MVHCDAATLAVEGEPGRSDLDGIRVSSETSRRMACDAAVVAMVHAKDGSLLSVGRRTRTIPPHIRRALEERDRGCRFPGCGGRFTEAHHVKHWADGGETSLRNTLLLCRRHHRAVHEGRVKVSVNRDGRNRNRVQRGRALPRLSYPLGDRSSCPGNHGGFSRTLSGSLARRADVSFSPPARTRPTPPACASGSSGWCASTPGEPASFPERGEDELGANGHAVLGEEAFPGTRSLEVPYRCRRGSDSHGGVEEAMVGAE